MLRVTMSVYDDETDEVEPRGTFILRDGGRIEIEPGLPPEGIAWMRWLMEDDCPQVKALDADGHIGGWVTPKSDPEGWLRGLQLQYTGRVQAELEEEEEG